MNPELRDPSALSELTPGMTALKPKPWIPAFAGMTAKTNPPCRRD